MLMDVKKHLTERYLNPDLYTVSWDDETACFALWNLSGQWVGYQQYRPFAPKTARNDPKRLRPWLGSLARHTVAVCDDDAAGARLGRLCDLAVTTSAGKDLGDMTPTQVFDFVGENFPHYFG